MGKLIVSIFAVLLLCNPCLAEDWYVSTAGAGAKNGTTYENAWDTAAKIVWGSIAPGDTLYIVGPIYGATSFVVGASGSEGNYVTIKGYDATSGIILGTTYGDTGWGDADEFGVYGRAYSSTVVDPIEWTTTPLTYTLLNNRGKAPDGDWVAGDYWYDTGVKLYYKPSGGVLAGKYFTIGYTGALSIDSHDWVKIEDLTLVVTKVNVGHTAAAQHIWLNNLTIKDVTASAINVESASNDGRISYCTISGVNNGIYLTGSDNDDWLIDHNTITDTFEREYRDGSWVGDSHGIGIQGGNRIIMEYNTITYANTGITMWTGLVKSMNDNIIRYNLIHDMEGLRGDGRAEGIGWEGTNLDPADMTGNYIYGNVVYDCTPSDSYETSGGGGIRPKMISPANYFYNNTVSNCKPNYYFQGVHSSVPMGAVIKNNLSISPKSTHWEISTFNNDDYSGVTFDYNNYYPNTGTLFKFEGATTNFADWKTALAGKSVVGADANSIVTDPLVVSTSDFHLQGASPAKAAGLNLGTGYTDFAGVSLPTPYGWPIGAYGYFSFGGGQMSFTGSTQ